MHLVHLYGPLLWHSLASCPSSSFGLWCCLLHTPPTATATSRAPPPASQLMIFQIQFLSSLRLLEANISKRFLDMLDSLKWLNLHFDVDWGFPGCEDDEEVRACSLRIR